MHKVSFQPIRGHWEVKINTIFKNLKNNSSQPWQQNHGYLGEGQGEAENWLVNEQILYQHYRHTIWLNFGICSLVFMLQRHTYMPQMVQRAVLKTKLYVAHQTTGNSSVICFPGVNCNVTIKLCVSSKTRRCKLYADCHLCGMKWHPYLVFLGETAYSPCWDQIKKRQLGFKWILCFW